MLPPRAQVAFLRDKLGGFAVVGFQKVDGFLPFGEPKFVLGHIECAVVVSSLFSRAQRSKGPQSDYPILMRPLLLTITAEPTPD